MWNQYRKTFIPIQLAIITACVLLYAYAGMPPGVALLYFVVMQAGALLGAMWAARLKGRTTPSMNELPLRHR